MSTNLRGALIGCGFFGTIQLEAWKRMPGVEIVAACDPDLSKAAAAAPSAYRSAAKMLDNEHLDFVDIATRPDTHLELVRLAVEHNLPAICQKPLATSMTEAAQMADICKHGSTPVMVHENWRWQPWYREAKRLIDAGAIGRPLSYNFRIRQRDGVGENPYSAQPYFRTMPRFLIYETLIHPIDTSRYLFGDIERVYARAHRRNSSIRGEDQAILMLSHSNKVEGIVDGHRFLNPEPAGPAMGDTSLEGDENRIQIDAEGSIFVGRELVWSSQAKQGYKGDSVFAIQSHFIDCLRNGTQVETPVSDYIEGYTAVEAAYESLEANRSVTLQEMRHANL